MPLSPGYEDPIKIQKVQREGLTPGSQKFNKEAKENTKSKNYEKFSNLEEHDDDRAKPKKPPPNKKSVAGIVAKKVGQKAAAEGAKKGTDAVAEKHGIESPNKFFFKKARTAVADAATGGMASKSGMKPIV